MNSLTTDVEGNLDLRLLIPGHDDVDRVFPGNIQPGLYRGNEVVNLLRDHRHNPEAIQFIADMLEE